MQAWNQNKVVFRNDDGVDQLGVSYDRETQRVSFMVSPDVKSATLDKEPLALLRGYIDSILTVIDSQTDPAQRGLFDYQTDEGRP